MSGGVLLLRGGHVIDPANEIDKEPYDVLLAGNKVLDVGEDIQLLGGGQVFDASGCLVCPGLVDLHVHCFPGGTLLGVDPDEWCLKRGVTTVVDAGSAGTYLVRWGKQCSRFIVTTRMDFYVVPWSPSLISSALLEGHDLCD